jgi:diguanylate cyclase (GGDEF)-like protein
MPATILLLDDEADFRALVKGPLVERGYRVLEADNCVAASVLVAESEFDLLIVDGHLPDQDGRDWIAAQRSSGNRVPIMFVTGTWNDFATYHHLVKELGVARVAYKPVVPLAFADMVDNFFETQNADETDAYSDGDDGLGELRDKYGQELPGKIAALTASMDVLHRSPQDEGAQKEAISQAHRLRGTAGSYGYHAVSSNCALLEEELRVWVERAQHKEPLSMGRVNDLLANVQHAMLEEIPFPAEPTGQASSILVLVVDDRFQFIERMSALGKAQGFRVIGATSTGQALHEYRLRPTDAAVIDLHLSGAFSGADLARQLREITGGIPLPIVLISDTVSLAEKAAAVHLGASELLGGLPTPEATVLATNEALSNHRLAQPRVVLLDDDIEFANLTRSILEAAGMSVTHITDSSLLQEVLARENAELLLLDVNLPIVSGFDLCRALRYQPRWQDLSILFLTARTDPASRIAAFEVGGDDYIPKPVVAIELKARIRARLERVRLLRERGDHDALTGLYTRRRFSESFSACQRQCERADTTMALVLLDLDKFKAVNDTYGHLIGDAVLARLGALLANRFRPQDLRGRWGGEEFILALPRLDGKTAKAAVERALGEFGQFEFNAKDGTMFHASFSAGIAVYPEDGHDQDDLVQCADQRLYRAKDSGRRCIVYQT